MDEQTLRILFTNTVLIANADGRVAPEERGFLNEFAVRAGITAEQMQTWLGEIRAGRAEFQAVEDPQHREALFALMVAVATSNSFILPTHQVNALVMGPGNYRVADFVRVGTPMTLIFLVVSVAVLYGYYG